MKKSVVYYPVIKSLALLVDQIAFSQILNSFDIYSWAFIYICILAILVDISYTTKNYILVFVYLY